MMEGGQYTGPQSPLEIKPDTVNLLSGLLTFYQVFNVLSGLLTFSRVCKPSLSFVNLLLGL